MLDCSEDDLLIFLADMTPLVVLTKTWGEAGKEVKLLHASLEDFLCDPERSGSLYLDEHLYLASKLGRCIQLLDLYSQNRSTEPEWPLIQIPDQSYRGLFSDIHETIRLSGNLDAVQGVLRRINLRYLLNCARLPSLRDDHDNSYHGYILQILVDICETVSLYVLISLVCK